MIKEDHRKRGEIVEADSKEKITSRESFDDPFAFDDVTSPPLAHGLEDEEYHLDDKEH